MCSSVQGFDFGVEGYGRLFGGSSQVAIASTYKVICFAVCHQNCSEVSVQATKSTSLLGTRHTPAQQNDASHY
jgi:hypothetical protein